MMFTEITPLITAALPFISSLLVAIITTCNSKNQKRAEAERKDREARDKAAADALTARQEARARLRKHENLISMNMNSCNMELGIATAIALREGKTNSALEDALARAKVAQAEYQKFLERATIRQMSE